METSVNKIVPLVSILMTAFNREKYISFAIESVIASSYKNWELIIVDDCSKDNTVEIAKQFERQDSRIKVYINEINLGDYTNRNKAASYATGKYIKYIDADDAIYWWGLEAEVTMMEQYPKAGYGLDDINQNDSKMFPFLLSPFEAYDSFYSGSCGAFNKAPTSCIIKREIFNEIGGFNNFRMTGDIDMWHRLSRYHFLLLMPQGIIWSRGHNDSESGKFKNNLAIDFRYLSVKAANLLHKDCPLLFKSKQKALARIRYNQVKICLKCILYAKFGSIQKIIRGQF
jgi:glycosyltransferase involved in cell wall biosynthesis